MSANRSAKIILHSLERSRSQRILWLLEELKLSYEIKPYRRGQHERAPPELKAIHPLGKAPVLEIRYPTRKGGDATADDERGSERGGGNGIVLAESAVIMEHLLENFHHQQQQQASAEQGQGERKSLLPPRWTPGEENQVHGETEAWRKYRYYMHYAEGSLMPLVVTNILMDVVQFAPPFFLRPFLGIIPAIVKKEYCGPNFETHLRVLENELSTPASSSSTGTTTSTPENASTTTTATVTTDETAARYLAGTQFTAADILMSYPLLILQEVNVLERTRYPALWAYVNRLREMEGYRKAVRVLEEVEGQAYRIF
ncbi:hypothetical protein BJX64DRAFT_257336 [Aspergillus heterothallicus]